MPAAVIRSLMRGRTTAMAALWLLMCLPCPAIEIPPKPLADLNSEDFRTREEAQAQILKWARDQPAAAMDLLYAHATGAAEPEVRERCLDVLRELVGDEYSRDGEGFIGIRMQEENAMVPGDPKRRGVIRVTLVMPQSPAEKAGLKVNDLIVGIEDRIWRDMPIILPFSDEVRKHKPGAKLKLSLLRDDKIVEVPVVLTRRPLQADNPFLNERQMDLEAAEAAARDAYFQRWLEQKRARE